jgi:hypothetical protein
VRQSRRSRLSLQVARNPLEAVDESRELGFQGDVVHDNDNIKIDLNNTPASAEAAAHVWPPKFKESGVGCVRTRMRACATFPA